MVEPVATEIVVEQGAPFSTPTKRSGRVARPSTKVRDTARQLDDTGKEARRITRNATRAASIETETDRPTEPRKNSGSSDGRAMLQKVLELLAESRTETKWLKEAFMEQKDIIENLQAMNRDMARQLKETKEQMAEEMGQVREQLEAIATRVTESPQLSYAEVARSPPSSQPSNIRTLSTSNTTASNVTDTLYCTIDTSRVEDGQEDQVTAGAIRNLCESEVRAEQGQTTWRCRAVTKDSKRPNRIRIACRDEAEHKMVKRLVEPKLTRGARILRDELYPVKVDHVNRVAVLDEVGDIRSGAAEAFGNENDAQVAKIAWLSNRDVPKAYGSMVVYLTRGSDARRLLSEGFFYAGGESGYTAPFERRPRPDQCFNCQQVGHKAYQCDKPQICGRCACEGHRHSACDKIIMRCALCDGPHESFSKNCRRLYPAHHE